MKKYSTRSQLKARSREQLLGKYGTFIPAILLIQFSSFIFSGTGEILGASNFASVIIIDFALTILVSLFLSLLQTGLYYMFLTNSCGRKPSLNDLFYGLSHDPGRIMKTALIPNILENGSLLPVLILLQLRLSGYEIHDYVLYAAYGLCLIINCYVSLAFSQVLLVLLDFPNLSPSECLKFSLKIMKGNKFRLFCLELSFFPLILLGVLSCCIGLLFIEPYIYATQVNFYLDLMKNRNR